MAKEWQELSRLTLGKPFTIEKVHLTGEEISIEGSFELPPLARLSMEDQVFVAAFVRYHGSIKEMEGLFGVSYPTIKNRLNRIAEQLEFVKIMSAPPQNDVLSSLDRGEITVEEALEQLKKQS